MKERPILFSAPMVRALLAGRKTQTRRVMSPQPEHLQHHEWRGDLVYEGEHRLWCWKTHTFENLVDEYIRDPERLELSCMSPYGISGDRLWVRETWSHDGPDIETCRIAHEDAVDGLGYGPYYRATEVAPDTLRWRPSIFMPRWASRITLEVTEVRVQQLQEISGEDAAAEGISVPRCGCEVCRMQSAMCPADASAHIEEFAHLWDSINGKRASWSNNPWVWAITFRPVSKTG